MRLLPDKATHCLLYILSFTCRRRSIFYTNGKPETHYLLHYQILCNLQKFMPHNFIQLAALSLSRVVSHRWARNVTSWQLSFRAVVSYGTTAMDSVHSSPKYCCLFTEFLMDCREVFLCTHLPIYHFPFLPQFRQV